MDYNITLKIPLRKQAKEIKRLMANKAFKASIEGDIETLMEYKFERAYISLSGVKAKLRPSQTHQSVKSKATVKCHTCNKRMTRATLIRHKQTCNKKTITN